MLLQAIHCVNQLKHHVARAAHKVARKPTARTLPGLKKAHCFYFETDRIVAYETSASKRKNEQPLKVYNATEVIQYVTPAIPVPPPLPPPGVLAPPPPVLPAPALAPVPPAPAPQPPIQTPISIQQNVEPPQLPPQQLSQILHLPQHLPQHLPSQQLPS